MHNVTTLNIMFEKLFYITLYLFLGMLLTMMTHDHKPPVNVVNMWLDSLLHDDIMIRYVAFQVIYFIPY